MFIITKKIHRARLAAGVAIFAVAVAFVGAGFGLAHSIRSAEASADPRPDPTGVRSGADRVAYLEAWGWLVEPEPAAIEEVLSPETCDASYDEYLALQESQGFHIQKYAGKTVKRYTYQVNNYPGLQEGIWASILVHKKTVIGGEIFSAQGDGFTQSLEYPAGS